MFRRILLPVDLSSRGDEAVRSCATGPGRDSDSVILLHVIENIEGVPDDELESFYGRLRSGAEDKLRAWAEELKGAGIESEYATVIGHRGPEIVRYAREHGADLVVLTSHAVDPSKPGGLGTISQQVALFAPCSVLLLRPAT